MVCPRKQNCATAPLFRLLILAVPTFSILALPTLLPAQTVPAGYQALYSALNTGINSFASQVNAGWNQSKTAPVQFAAELYTANCENGSQMLAANYFANSVQPEINEFKAMGVKALYVAIDFPVLSPAYYTYENSTNYQSYLSFYQQVTNAIRAAGLKMIVESNAVLTTGGFGGSWNAGPYYASLTLAEYQAGRAAQAATIVGTLKPDYLSVLDEPDTESTNTGFTAIDTVSGATTLLNQILAAIDQAGQGATLIGAGIGSWTPSWQSWMQSFATAGVQYLDIHVYQIVNTYLSQLPAMAQYAASLGKPMAMGQFWLAKESVSQLGILTYTQVAALDPFSFWAPLDTSFLQSMVNFAYWQNLLFLSPFWTDYFHVYLPYNSTTSAETPSQLLTQVGNDAGQDIYHAVYSSTGVAYGKAISNPPDTTPPSAPTGLSAPENYTAVNLTWKPSTDNVGVAGYMVYRNGVELGTTSQTTWFDSGLKESTTYTYTVAAYDGVMNISALSTPFIITTLR